MIETFGKYTNVRQAASSSTTHGMTNQQVEDMHARMNSFMPRLEKFDRSHTVKSMFEKDLPAGASWSKSAQAYPANLGQGGNLHTVQTPYQPEFADPSRQQYPVHRILANRYWRMFYKLDPTISTGIDLYGDLPWSNFELTGEGIEGEIRQAYEYMCRETQLLAMLPAMVREFLIVGETIPHVHFDDSKGVFVHIALHNPDQLEVIDAPFIKMEPFLEFIPDDRLLAIVNSNEPGLAEIRESMPPELVTRLQSKQRIPLSPLNATFIPRKMHPYDTRGTSIISRMWRILMYEDAVFNASIQMARRHACFVPGTQVLMADGLKNIEDVKVGDRIVAGNGKIETVESAWQEPPSPTVSIKALGTETLQCTPNHNFLIWRRPDSCACGCGGKLPDSRGTPKQFLNGHNTANRNRGVNLAWKTWSERPIVKTLASYEPIQKVPAADIKAGDYLLIPRGFDEIQPDCTLDQARLLGYYVAEGSPKSVNKYEVGGTAFSFGLASSARENSYVEDVVRIAASLGAHASVEIRHTPSARASGRRPSMCVSFNRVSDIWLTEWLIKHGGRGAATKRLSEDVMRWPLEYKKQFIRGLYSGDGCHNAYKRARSHQVAMGLVSRAVIHQVKQILAQIGIFSSISHNPKHNQGWNDTWIISSTGADARSLCKLVFGETIDSPFGKESRQGMKTWMDDSYIYVPVISVCRNEVLVPVYNLTVSGDHSYTANTVQTFNSPIKVVKMGNASTGWIPPPEQEQKMLQLLAQAELDVNSWLVTHYGVAFEAWGSNDRAISISRELDTIERLKLISLGISKSFLTGESSFATAATGLQVFMQRLKSLRLMFEQKWLYSKFFRPIAEINGWIKSKPSEVQHRFRVKRSAAELNEMKAYIVPKIVWDKSLDPQVNNELINAMQALEGIGVKFSKTSKMAAVGYSFEEETKKINRELKFEKQFNPKVTSQQGAEEGGGGMGGLGGGGMPPMGGPPMAEELPGPEEGGQTPPGLGGEPPPGIEEPPAAPKPASKTAGKEPKPSKSSFKNLRSKIWVDDKYKDWEAGEVSELVDMLDGAEPDAAFWYQLFDTPEFTATLESDDRQAQWELVRGYLESQNYPDSHIDSLRSILQMEKILPKDEYPDEYLMSMPNSDNMSDDEFATAVSGYIKKMSNNKFGQTGVDAVVGYGAPADD